MAVELGRTSFAQPAATGNPATRRNAPATPGSASPTSTAGTQWAQLVEQVRGSVIRPGDSAYRHARLDYDPRFDDIRPSAIVFVESEQDVARTIAFARENHLPFAVRCGG